MRWGEYAFGGYDIGEGLSSISNIIWSTGRLDPWGGGGFDFEPKANSKSVHRFILQKGAHHYDLRGFHPGDTEEVKRVRYMEEKIIREWIEEYARNK